MALFARAEEGLQRLLQRVSSGIHDIWSILSRTRQDGDAEEDGQALIAAAARGDLKQVQAILDKGADVDARDETAATA
jgi:hypothetical protein